MPRYDPVLRLTLTLFLSFDEQYIEVILHTKIYSVLVLQPWNLNLTESLRTLSMAQVQRQTKLFAAEDYTAVYELPHKC